MERDTSEKIIDAVNKCVSELLNTLPMVEGHAPEEDFKKYKRSVAKIINTMDVEIVEKIGKEYPDLTPWGEDSSV